MLRQLKIREKKGLKDLKLKIKQCQNNLKQIDNKKLTIEKQDSEMMPKQSLKTVIWNSLWMNINQIKKNHLVENKENSTNKTALKTKKAKKAIKAVKKTLEKINKILEINKRSECS